jgi:hypothetical protein
MLKKRPPSAKLRAEEAASIDSSAIVLLMIWMMMTPVPVIALLPAGCKVELAILSVPLAKIDAVGTVFAFIPCMVVMMIAIVVAGMIATGGNYNFLGAGLVCCRGRERGRQKNKTQIFGCCMQVILRYRELR